MLPKKYAQSLHCFVMVSYSVISPIIFQDPWSNPEEFGKYISHPSSENKWLYNFHNAKHNKICTYFMRQTLFPISCSFALWRGGPRLEITLVLLGISSVIIQIWWKSHFVFTKILMGWSLQNFAHAMTAVLSWHVQKFVVIWWSEMELQQDDVSIEFDAHQGNIVSKMGLWCLCMACL